MQFKVPQNIDLEDKIIGPLTLVQFMYLLIGGMIFYLTLKFGNVLLLLVIGIPALTLGLFLGFIKIQDQPFSRFLGSLSLYVARPKVRVWKKVAALEGMSLPVSASTARFKRTQAALGEQLAKRQRTRSRLDELATLLDTQGEQAVAEAGGTTATSPQSQGKPA